MTRSERAFRALLRAYPAATREASGDDMAQLFADRLRDARTPWARARVWLDTVADVAATAPRERLVHRRAARVAEGPGLGARRPVAPDLGAASAPLLVAAALLVVRPAYYAPILDDRAALLGAPLGVTVLCLTAVLAAIGTLAARRSQDLADPGVQALLLAWLLAPAGVLFIGLGGVDGLTIFTPYAILATLLALVARFRALMLALAVPFVVWLLLGPAVLAAVITGST